MGEEEIKKEIEEVKKEVEEVKKEVEEVRSGLENQIIRQVEYYFGNFNLYKDKFLREQVKLNDGWIPMETMVKFRRLKALSEDYDVITSALKKSSSGLMEVHEDGTKIRRNPELAVPANDEEHRKDVDARSIYVKGFKPTTGLDELLEFFLPYGSYENIHMRRRKNKNFKGSVFVVFVTLEAAEKFFEWKDVKFNGTELLREWKADYVKRKDEFFDDLRQKRDEKQKRKTEEKEKNGAKTEEKMDTSSKVDEGSASVTKGCILKLTGLSGTTMWEHIKEVLNPHGKVMYVDYSKGKPEAYVRFESGVAAEVMDKVATEKEGVKTISINDTDAAASVLEGEEELEYWKTIAKVKAGMKQRHPVKGGRQHWGKGRGRGRNRRKRQRDQDDDDEPEPPKKALKNSEDDD